MRIVYVGVGGVVFGICNLRGVDAQWMHFGDWDACDL